MTVYCLFCGTVLLVEDTKATCTHCEATFTLMVKRGCVRQVVVGKCGKECTC